MRSRKNPAPEDIRREELSNFLRTRRERRAPADVGLNPGARRRTPGLRREEVAQLAGISTTWYTWLEQKRPVRVSAPVLNNLARVLDLSAIEKVQLFNLALRDPAADRLPHRPTVSPVIQRTLDQMETVAGFVLSPRWDVLAWNRAARAFFFDFPSVPADERNLVWLTFTHPALKSLMVDWPTRAQDVLARFRGDYGRHAGDAHFTRLVERLRTASRDFAEWWPRHDVQAQSEGRKQYQHPTAGRIHAEHLTFSMTDNPELRMTLFAPVAEADSITRFRRLIASFTTNERRNGAVNTN
jgi:transcriptional regulator with XRE-family HTH domain